jgi:hypothetical protein
VLTGTALATTAPPSGLCGRAGRGLRGRRGVSLLEVLISIFVLAFGLLGVAALIPLGRFALVETGKADRSAACGRAGMREVKVRNMLDPARWWNAGGAAMNLQLDNSGAAFTTPTGYTATQWPNRGQSVCIDPVGTARYGFGAVATFPFANDTSGLANEVRMPRITLDAGNTYHTGGSTVMPVALAQRVFTWGDDLLFEINEDEETYRPERLYSLDVGTGFGVDPSAAITGEAEGNYSWMATVTPAASEAPLGYAEKKTYTVSIVVFYKRDFEVVPAPTASVLTPAERLVQAEFQGLGLGGGEVELRTAHSPDYLNLREKEWVMLCGQTSDERFGSGAVRNVFKWYRVVMTDDEPQPDGSDYLTYATLTGPDWNDDWNVQDSDGDGLRNAYAVLLDGVIGVYSTTIELDE